MKCCYNNIQESLPCIKYNRKFVRQIEIQEAES